VTKNKIIQKQQGAGSANTRWNEFGTIIE